MPQESQILRDLLYVFQGVEGRLLKYFSLQDKFLLDSNINLPRPTRQIVNDLAEIGWLYFKITKGLDSLQNGLFSQVRYTSKNRHFQLQSRMNWLSLIG